MQKIVDVTAAVIVKNDEILITQRPDNKSYGGMWEFPGGKLEAGESLEECLKREIEEELGISISITGYLGTVSHIIDSSSGINLHAYMCSYVSGELYLHEHQDYEWTLLSKLGSFDLAPADIEVVRLISKRAD